MATIRNTIFIDVYSFDTIGNAFLRKETMGLPVPFQAITDCRPGPDNAMRVYSKLTTGNPPTDYYVGQTIAEIAALIVQ